MDVEAMRRAGYATVDALVARLANPGADPVPPAIGEAATAIRVWPPCSVPNPAGSSNSPSSDFHWLADTEPTVRAELAKIRAERLRAR